MKNEDTLEYLKIHDIKEPVTMGLMFQRNSTASWNWSMLRHPHQENIIFISGRPVCDPYSYSENFILDEITGKLKDVFYYSINEDREAEFPSDIKYALEFYKKIESMSEFQNGFTYQMEFGTNPLSIYQFRPFRKIEKPSWKLEIDNFGFSHEYPIVFGITPKEGLELIIARVLSEKDLSPIRDSLDKSVSKINSIYDKERTIISQSNIHFYKGKDIDLIFPNAKAWIAEGAHQFLSHNLFRAMQYYNLVFIGLNTHDKTGDKVRVFSDGVNRVIKKI